MVWLMETGTASVKIGIVGAAGKGEAIVPVMAVATAKRDMEPSLGWILAGLALLLFVLMVTIIGASVSDGTLKPGEALSQRMKKKRLVTMGLTVIVCGLILYGGGTWWNSWAKDYEQYLYRPYKAKATVAQTGGGRVMSLHVDSTSLEKRWLSYLVPDHGKLMHLFLVKQGTQDVFAHLHPVRKDTLTYDVKLPSVPAGRYLVFADVVRWHGFASTIATTVDIPAETTPVKLASYDAGITAANPDPDNTYIVTNPIDNAQIILADSNSVLCGKPGVRSELPDGSSIVWEQQPNSALSTGKLYSLTFSVQTPEGNPAQLEPYLGMNGHAVVVRNDGSVFIHLHPVGNYSMASQQALQARMGKDGSIPKQPDSRAFRDSIDRELALLENMSEAERNKWLMPDMDHTATISEEHDAHAGSVVTFPYAFPQPGNYRIWVQIKRNGKILTAAFDAVVKG
jgi:hypothetical protein